MATWKAHARMVQNRRIAKRIMSFWHTAHWSGPVTTNFDAMQNEVEATEEYVKSKRGLGIPTEEPYQSKKN